MADKDTLLTKALAAAGKYPEYGKLAAYLASVGKMPDMRTAVLDEGVRGQYVLPGYGDKRYTKPTLELDKYFVASSSPTQIASTVLHELTHSAQDAFREEAKGTNRQFVEGYKKLYETKASQREQDMPLRRLADSLNATWAQTNQNYRSAPFEIQAFGVGNAATKRPESTGAGAPAHLDATAATEFMILLDLATRAQQQKD